MKTERIKYLITGGIYKTLKGFLMVEKDGFGLLKLESGVTVGVSLSNLEVIV